MRFVHTRAIGTCNLFNTAKNFWKANMGGKRFYHISSEEVYGELYNPTEFLWKLGAMILDLLTLPQK